MNLSQRLSPEAVERSIWKGGFPLSITGFEALGDVIGAFEGPLALVEATPAGFGWVTAGIVGVDGFETAINDPGVAGT
jgi:hypothetical protein